MPEPEPSFVVRARARLPWPRERDVDVDVAEGQSKEGASTGVDGSEGTWVDEGEGAAGEAVAWAQTFATPEPDPLEARAFAAQKRRLMARMFGQGEAEAADEDAERFGHYVLLRELGDGGMGRVYEAYDESLDRKVAIKTLLEFSGQSQLRARLVREAKAMARLTHPNVVRVYEIGESSAGPYIVMEYVEGQTLRAWLDSAERSLEAILTVFRAVGEGLAAIHEAGLVHRDVKPDNVMVDGQGRVLVMDLGIVHGRPEPLGPSPESSEVETLSLETRTGAMLGTPYYMAPEQFEGRGISARTDQYSLCVSLWEAVYGERPVRGSSLAALTAAVLGGQRRPPSQPERAPVWLRAVLDRGMAVDAADRFESMHALVAALGERPKPVPARRPWLIAAGLGVAALGVVLGLPSVLGSSATEVEPSEAHASAASAEPDTPDAASARPAPILDPSLDALVDYALLSGGAGLVYIDSEGLWVRDFGPSPARKLHSGKVHRVQVSSTGGVYFSAFPETGGGGFELFHLPTIDALAERIEGRVGAYFCLLEDQGKLASTYQDSDIVQIFALGDEGLALAERIELGDNPDWTEGLACDTAHDRIAVLQQMRSRGSKVRLFELAEGGQASSFELRAPRVRTPRFSPEGDVLYYLIDRGLGFELEGRTLEGRPRVFEALVDQGKETIAYAIAPDGRAAYTLRYNVSTTIARWPGGAPEVPPSPRWQLEIPSLVLDVAISPDEQTLALAETAPGVASTISIVALDSVDKPSSFVREAPELGRLAWSPDGQRLAYLAEHRGESRVWLTPIEGGEARVFEDSAGSVNVEIAWTPSQAIIYQKPGLSEYALLDPETGSEREIFDLDELSAGGRGYSFFARPSPDGSRIALGWNRVGCVLSIVGIEDGREQILSSEGPTELPIGWSPEGDQIYTTTFSDRFRVMRHPVEGGDPQPWLDLGLGDMPVSDGFMDGCTSVFAGGDVLCTQVEHDQRLVLSEGPLRSEPDH